MGERPVERDHRERVVVADLLTLLAGSVLICLLVPCMQWLDRGTLGNSVELNAPVPGAVGLLAALVLVNAGCYLVGRFRLVPRRSLLVLYLMLSASLPFCSVGLVQVFYTSVSGVASEYLDRQIPTIRAGYDSQNPDFFPKLEQGEYQEYLACFTKGAAFDPASSKKKARQREILLPLKRYWAGVSVDAGLKDRFADPSWGLKERVGASFSAIPWGIWRPVLWRWGVLFLLLLMGTMCLARLFDRDWTERENLPFPVAQLPLMLLESGGQRAGGSAGDERGLAGGLRSAYFWAGALIAGGLVFLSGLAHYNLVRFPLSGAVTFERVDLRQILIAQPWVILKDNFISLSPLLIGIALMVHQDILRGCLWVFGGLMGLRLVVGIFESSVRDAVGAGWLGNQMPYYSELGLGALALFALHLLWKSRGALGLGRASGMADDMPDRRGRWAGVGFVLVLAGLAGWWYWLGLDGWKGMAYLAFFFCWTLLTAVAVSRLRAEGCFPLNAVGLAGRDVAFCTGSVPTYGIHTVQAFNSSYFLTVSALPGLLAAQMEGLYLCRRLRVSRRLLGMGIFLAFGLAVAVGLVSFLVLCYWQGAQVFSMMLQDASKKGLWNTYAGGDVNYRMGLDPVRVWMIPAGIVVMGALLYVRRHFPRFPAPPISFLIVCLGVVTVQQSGLAMGYSFWDLEKISVNFIWGPILIACVAKALVLRFGGMDLYVKMLPLAPGLIFGQAVMWVAWNVYHAVAAPGGAVFTGVFQ